ncbi:transcriptional regulator [Salinarimonas sp. NSM]|uniref:transcriptional regulator n=1 Tax=Salinarimonas sp. NSM TaxID=3458003 RepID=UPI004036C36C
MAGPFTEFLAKLRSPHVARALLARLDLPSGEARLHSGAGPLYLDGEEWTGVTDPEGGQLLFVGQIDEPTFGTAAAVTLTLTGANREFFRSVHATAAEVEGRSAVLYWCAFDMETGEIIIPPKPLFPRGLMTAPSLEWAGIARRIVALTLESVWHGFRFSPGGRWNAQAQLERWPGDKGGQFIGVKVEENWT